MKPIKYSSKFKSMYKQYIGREDLLVQEFLLAVEIFFNSRESAYINDHDLEENLEGFRAFSVNDDIRVIYRETEDSFVFLRVGPHNVVYR